VRLYHLFAGDETITKIVKSDDTNEDDKKVNEENSKLVKKAMIILAMGCIIGIIISTILWYIVKGGESSFNFMSDIVFKNLLVLLFVALTQVIFFYTISRTYKSLDENTIIRKVIEDNSS